jgi:hypothetical protein
MIWIGDGAIVLAIVGDRLPTAKPVPVDLEVQLSRNSLFGYHDV